MKEFLENKNLKIFFNLKKKIIFFFYLDSKNFIILIEFK
jgi:hypothetical protein